VAGFELATPTSRTWCATRPGAFRLDGRRRAITDVDPFGKGVIIANLQENSSPNDISDVTDELQAPTRSAHDARQHAPARRAQPSLPYRSVTESCASIAFAVGPNGQQRSSGTLLIPGAQVGAVINSLAQATQELDKRLREAAEQQAAVVNPSETPRPVRPD
jgi:hypothetical protein